jgi:hypothetical protein
MVARTRAIAGCCLLLSPWSASAEPPAAPVSVLSCALADRMVARLSALQAWTAPAALVAIAEHLLAAERLDDAVSIAGEMADSYARVELTVDLADRLERAARTFEAEGMINAVLGVDAGTPAGQDRLLVAFARVGLANQSPFLTRQATAEQRRILTARFGCR